MQHRTFGQTNIETSVIGFGTWALGSKWWGDHEDSDKLIHHALDIGVRFFDSSDVYGQGLNEKIVGKALANSGRSRDEYQLATKFGYAIEERRSDHRDSERPQDWSPQHTRRALEASLKRLQTDYVDIYQLHNPRMDAIDNESLFAELEALKAEGKIRSYGVALGPAIGWRDEGVHACNHRNIGVLQIIHNLLEQDPGRDLLAAAGENNVGIIVRVPTSSGMLEGNLTAETTFGPNDHRRHRTKEWLIEGLQKVEQLEFLKRNGQRTTAQIAYKFLLADPRVTTIVHTVTTTAQLDEWAAAGTAAVPDLDSSEIAHINRLYEENFSLVTA